MQIQVFDKTFEPYITATQINEQIKKKFVKTLLTPYSNSKFLPEQDFYTYNNNLWLEKTNLNISPYQHVSLLYFIGFNVFNKGSRLCSK